jgi:nucleotide-binding universal stress UspA family protein
MFRNILLCYDGSDAGRRALKRGAELALLVKANVYVLSILPRIAGDVLNGASAAGQMCIVDLAAEHRKSMEESLSWLKARGVEAKGELAQGDILEEVALHAKRHHVDLVVVGHYPQARGGRWWSGGSQRAALAERVTCCVMIATEDAPENTSS